MVEEQPRAALMVREGGRKARDVQARTDRSLFGRGKGGSNRRWRHSSMRDDDARGGTGRC